MNLGNVNRKKAKNWIWIIVVVAVIAIVILGMGAIKNLLVSIGVLESPDQKAYKKLIEDGRVSVDQGAAVDVKAQYAKQAPTKTDFEWVQIADQIYADLRVKLDQDVSDAGYQLARCKNDSDCLKLIQAFGNRSIYTFGIPYQSMTLPQFVASQLDTKAVQTINNNYQAKGIRFRW